MKAQGPQKPKGWKKVKIDRIKKSHLNHKETWRAKVDEVIAEKVPSPLLLLLRVTGKKTTRHRVFASCGMRWFEVRADNVLDTEPAPKEIADYLASLVPLAPKPAARKRPLPLSQRHVLSLNQPENGA